MDAINGVDKNTIHRELTKQLAAPEKVCKSSSTANLLQPFSFSNVSGEGKYSAAENCKAVLERCGKEGVKSVSKRAKRERERGTNNRHWHVRKLEEKLSEVKCETIKDFQKLALFLMCTIVTLAQSWAQDKLPSGDFPAIVKHVMR